ncbi:MAG: heme-binding protein [Proteobacteria bacterium]|nr:heme-binding protein [Pseudomonadota bacterium]
MTFFATTKRLTSRGAKAMMAAATADAQNKGFAVSIAIVDAGGHVLLLERMDGGRFHTVHSARTKAACAASNRRPTTTRGAEGQELDLLHAVGLSLAAGPERWTPMEGGLPIMVDGECVGGIGVAGATWEEDEHIAKVALNAVGASPPD